MKSTCQPTTNTNYPKLQIAPNNNVFLMNTKTSGTIVHVGAFSEKYYLGTFHTDLNSQDMVDYKKQITLEN